MNRKIANILKQKISHLDFADRLAGMVSPVSVNIKSGDRKVQKTYPISCDLTENACIKGMYQYLTPDSRYKSVMYFEDQGVRYVRHEADKVYYESTLRLVGWLNLGKLHGMDCIYDKCDITGCAITNIIQAISGFPQHDDPFLNVYSVVTAQIIRDANIFGRYTYNEERTQYLMYPYDYFALTIQTAFAVPVDCILPCFSTPVQPGYMTESLYNKFLFLWVGDYTGDDLQSVINGDVITVTGRDWAGTIIPPATAATFRVPNTAPYMAADGAELFWFNGPILEKTHTELVESTTLRTFVRYRDFEPYDVSAIGILNPLEVLTGAERDELNSFFRLWVQYWGETMMETGYMKDNRIFI